MKRPIKSVTVALCTAASVCALGNGVVSATAATTCVDGSKRANLSVAWNAANNVTVSTVANKPLCADTTIFFSSYTMPDNYNGQGFSMANETAWPQAVFNSTSTVLKKDAKGGANLKITLPENCKNIQVDVYYAPEVKIVTSAGHGNQYISGKIIAKTQNTCAPAPTPTPKPTPVVPVPEAQTPATPLPQVTLPAATPATPQPMPTELPKTGTNLAQPLSISAAVAATGYAVSYAFSKRKQ
jgi:hypothetical protein